MGAPRRSGPRRDGAGAARRRTPHAAGAVRSRSGWWCGSFSPMRGLRFVRCWPGSASRSMWCSVISTCALRRSAEGQRTRRISTGGWRRRCAGLSGRRCASRRPPGWDGSAPGICCSPCCVRRTSRPPACCWRGASPTTPPGRSSPRCTTGHDRRAVGPAGGGFCRRPVGVAARAAVTDRARRGRGRRRGGAAARRPGRDDLGANRSRARGRGRGPGRGACGGCHLGAPRRGAARAAGTAAAGGAGRLRLTNTASSRSAGRVGVTARR